MIEGDGERRKLVAVTCWVIWKLRNEVVRNDKGAGINTVVSLVHSMINQWDRAQDRNVNSLATFVTEDDGACQLKSKTGNHYNPVTNSFNFTEEEWDQLCKRNKYVETLKSRPLSYPELCTHLYDGIVATGVSGWGPSSKRSRTVDTNDEKEIPDIEVEEGVNAIKMF
ncbi:hypothetical protein POM88_045360 [Heracleum sosnowskyi]|uniref:Uncharacterized protein n=1 Tax=Heracleum sosnowskyi TaxID=360622 RepID=A0AAD8M4V8_9APIA|nr:hypothetical protein POM88_045360 [Heracleum sosnowskyi]